MEEKWEAGPVNFTETTVHLQRSTNEYAECKPYTKEEVVHVVAQVNAPGFGNALTARLRDAQVGAERLCVECFPEGFRNNYARALGTRVTA